MNEMAEKTIKRRRMAISEKLVIAGVILVSFLSTVFFDTWCGIQSRRKGYEIVEARMEQENLRDFQKALKIEQARLSSPPLLRRYAVNEYKLDTPKPDQIVIVP
jgi:hypothetical protein